MEGCLIVLIVLLLLLLLCKYFNFCLLKERFEAVHCDPKQTRRYEGKTCAQIRRDCTNPGDHECFTNLKEGFNQLRGCCPTGIPEETGGCDPSKPCPNEGFFGSNQYVELESFEDPTLSPDIKSTWKS